ncbi:MAG: threonine synthase [Planctomycetaceae bacterium]|nr:threonine synthase [Planctomycetaceae bacterium]
MHTSLKCAACGRDHAVDQLQNLCTDCGKPLLVGYDLESLRSTFTPDVVRSRATRSMWRFQEVMPVEDMSQVVSLGEGQTPLLRCRDDGAFEGFSSLWVKDESFNPTGSFKARGMSAAVTRARALGATSVALPSAGNAAGAATYYAAAAGMECVLFMPEDTPPANIIESVVGGARVHLVNGLIGDCGKLVGQGRERFGWFDLSTLKEPFRIEGKKTMGYELAFDLAADGRLQLPDVVFYPTGGGTGLIGMWKAFDEMQQLGWIGSERPRMVVVQAEHCAPIVRAFEAGADSATPFENARTVASGLRVPAAIGDFLMLQVLGESDGTAVSVSDEELLNGVHEMAAGQGLYLCPEAGAVWAAAKRLRESGWLDSSERIVLFNTGSGLKYNHLFPSGELVTLDHDDPACLDILA